MAKVALPRYMRPKKTKSGLAYYWELPSWARKGALRDERPCPVVATALGTDLLRALEQAAQLNEALDGWRKGETRTDLAPGSVAWLFRWYQTTVKFKRLSPKTKADYRKLMQALKDTPMKRGVFGQRDASKVDAEAADKLYERFREKGERQATYAMQVCRLVWNWAGRYEAKTGIAKGENPFAGMALNHRVAEGNRAATRDEYDRYRLKARELGFQSMAAAAALAFELVQRPSDCFGYEDLVDPDTSSCAPTDRGIKWEDYRPRQRITVRQNKTGKRITIPLSDGSGATSVSLYPELELELSLWSALASGATGLIVTEERSGEPYKERRMSTVHRQICDAAGLPKDLRFTSFRHGGATELGDAGEADIRPISGHSQLNTTSIYNKANETKARLMAARRREHIALISGQSETEGE